MVTEARTEAILVSHIGFLGPKHMGSPSLLSQRAGSEVEYLDSNQHCDIARWHHKPLLHPAMPAQEVRFHRRRLIQPVIELCFSKSGSSVLKFREEMASSILWPLPVSGSCWNCAQQLSVLGVISATPPAAFPLTITLKLTPSLKHYSPCFLLGY